tara:strand:+ start:201 stop:737 length:537 start_codon:yes stop_codon:yes gene_type:complete
MSVIKVDQIQGSTGTTVTIPSGTTIVNSGTATNFGEAASTGTWTPIFVSSSATFSYSTQVGTYFKIGVFVHCLFRLALSGSPGGTTSNALSIGGLPFNTAAVTNGYFGGHIGHFFNINLPFLNVSNGPVDLCYQINAAEAGTVELKVTGDSTAETTLLPSNLESSTEIRGNIMYHAAS